MTTLSVPPAPHLHAFLRPGDVLLYRPKGIFGWIISRKTWRDVGHVEIFRGWSHYGPGLDVVASRNGQGVNAYRFEPEGLCYVLRPRGDVDLASADQWFETVRGQKYDWLGLLRFAWNDDIGTGNNNRMFCSEFAHRWLRAARVFCFPDIIDADSVAPGTFLESLAFWIYRVLGVRAHFDDPRAVAS